MRYEEKLKKLEEILQNYGKLAVALSGGVDSTFLLLMGKKVLGDQMVAVTATAPNFAADEIEYAQKLCEREKVRHVIVELSETILSEFAHNPPERCYLCKKAIFSRMLSHVEQRLPGFTVADGTNLDDMQDYRPGRKALEELGIKSPIRDAGLTKEEVRRGLKDLGQEIWKKPAFACLASRIPYGERITVQKLEAVYQAEKFLQKQGFDQVRVRHHGTLARIEVLPEQRGLFDEAMMDRVADGLKNLGFSYVALDLSGYRMGNLNQEIE